MLLREILSADDTIKMIKTVILSWPDVTIKPSLSGSPFSFKVQPKNGDLEAMCLFRSDLDQLTYSITGKSPMGGLTGEYSLDNWTLEKTLDKLEAWVAKVNKPPRKRAPRST
jgi:hypothetical protein